MGGKLSAILFPDLYGTFLLFRSASQFKLLLIMQQGKIYYTITFNTNPSLIYFLFSVLRITDNELFTSHIKEWEKFWSGTQINADGDDELVKNFLCFIRSAVDA